MSSSLCGSFCKSNGCKTKIHYDIASYVWTIEDFDFHEAKGEALVSPVFSSVTNNQVKWYLKLKPNGEIEVKDSMTVFLCKQSSIESNKKIFAKITFYVLNSEGKETFNQPMRILEFAEPQKNNCGLAFMKKDTIYQLLWNNTMAIRCEVKFSDMNDILAEDNHQWDCNIEVPECNLPENLASLFENQEITDVVLSVNGKDFPAHKVVLAACSPVFHAMFKHNTKENQLNRIDIEDINQVVVGEMLKYIYTGKCQNLNKFAGELLAAADKYDLYQLKMTCAKILLERLSVENAASVLAIADMHSVKQLKNEVIKFIVSKPTEVLATEGWKSIRSNFELVDEVLCSASALPVPDPSTSVIRRQSWWAAANSARLVPILLFFLFFLIF
ncbi:speckle-type POZ protein B-like [Planococcus citri]|uniref:speckle-type POZ protein B-like n=1 Tax=Planococcus citri TaxID=170843 RepID=UPI0031F8C677